MRMILLCAVSLALSACATPVGNGSPPSDAVLIPGHAPDTSSAASPLTTVTVKATQALIVAELAYNTAGNVVLAATQSGLIRPGSPTAVRIRAINADIQRALEVARTASSAAEQTEAIASAVGSIALLRSLVPGGVS